MKYWVAWISLGIRIGRNDRRVFAELWRSLGNFERKMLSAHIASDIQNYAEAAQRRRTQNLHD